MRISIKIRIITCIIVLSIPGMSAALDIGERHMHDRESRDRDTRNPLIEEMVKLDAVFHEVVSGVALGDGARVREALETMHGVMEKTHEGVQEGTVKLAKNANRMTEFVAQDKQFHSRLEALADAAGKNRRKDMLNLTKDLLDRCVRCHTMFRKG
jgi:cytochrome c556